MSMLPTTYLLLRPRVAAVLAASNEPLSARAISEAIGKNRNAVRTVLAGMKAEGLARATKAEDDSNLWTVV